MIQSKRVELEQAFIDYRHLCYPGIPLSPVQLKEVRQAFYSGIHWMNQQREHPDQGITECLRILLDVPKL